MIDTNTETGDRHHRGGEEPAGHHLGARRPVRLRRQRHDNTVSVINAETMTVTATIPTGNSPTSVAVLPTGTEAYVTNLTDGTVTVLNIAS